MIAFFVSMTDNMVVQKIDLECIKKKGRKERH